MSPAFPQVFIWKQPYYVAQDGLELAIPLLQLPEELGLQAWVTSHFTHLLISPGASESQERT